jgi:drug/metabolite transporter (DMT)-like permease
VYRSAESALRCRGPPLRLFQNPPEFALPLSPNLRGSLLMAVAMAGFSVNDAASKFLTTQMNFGQVMLLRGLFACILIGALAAHQGAMRPLRVLFVPAVMLRVCGEIGGSGLFLVAISYLSLGNVTAIVQSLPLAMTLGAVLLLGEPVGWRRWMAIAAGFVGVLIIVRPGAEGFNQYSLLALLAVGFYAMRELVTKKIPAEIPTLFVSFLTTIAVTIAGAVLMVAFGGWHEPSLRSVGLLILAAVTTLIGYQCAIMALRAGEIAAVAPFRYSQMLWAMLLGFLVFGEVPDIAMVIGASVIMLSGIYAFHRERVRNRPLAVNASAMPPDGL